MACPLVLGRSWARWLATLGGLVAVVVALMRLGRAGQFYEDARTVRSLPLISIAFCGAVALILALSPAVAAFFRAPRPTPGQEHETVREWDRVFGLPPAPPDSERTPTRHPR